MALWFMHLGVYVGHGKSGREVVLLGLAGLPLALWARIGRQARWWSLGGVAVSTSAVAVTIARSLQ